MAFWVGAVQASKPSPLKGSWALRGPGPPAVAAAPPRAPAPAGARRGGGAAPRAPPPHPHPNPPGAHPHQVAAERGILHHLAAAGARRIGLLTG
ncbi:hypothetical protein ACFV0A_25295, partial [Streptomyces sp. NPDC059552]